ncbi:hypothetical protein [Raineyella fluvialis]|uniref:Uncharacterized protein n=1 Tax=Raineyella fluvialis TaxID=2662261 RepID=A0A5Q2F637_9ACTN|nr:hypothetical protein [Raineyella fluvialis]QGF22430.1 hypothetical protein Rai3103_00600 [Raineyella fluvialis]
MALPDSWSVTPWGRYDEEPPDPGIVPVTGPDGREMELRERLDPAWHAAHWHYGAEIRDRDRGVTYRATVGQDARLDYLSVEVAGDQIDQNSLRRLPTERIRRVTASLANVTKRGRVAFILAGEPSSGTEPVEEGQRGDKPPLSEVAHRMLTLGEGRHELAAHYGRNVRTVDNWIREARVKRLIPETRAELRARQERNRAAHMRQRENAQDHEAEG